jgi:16S rRNA (cytidine1402-2'-O)-methyltransferase
VSGRLVLVATPIGNLGDLSPRAVEAMRTAAIICCEDTRRTATLLRHAGISGIRMVVANEHTEHGRIDEIVEILASGRDVAFVSDAGTPGISDPGERVVRGVIAAGHTVTAVPGPAAVVMALVLSGLPADRFVFEGFVPRSGAERRARLAEVASERRTIVLYEAPHRLARTIDDLVTTCGPDRRLALCRELTKLHEEIWRGTLAEAAEHVATKDPRGEYVIVLGGRPVDLVVSDDDAVRAALTDAIARGASRKTAADEVAATLGVARKHAYDLATKLPR